MNEQLERKSMPCQEEETSVKILLYSGGMDSYLIRRLWNPDFCFYVNVDSAYSSREMKNIRNLNVLGAESLVSLVRGISLSRFERPDSIIPYRNVYMVLAALNEYERRFPLEKFQGDTRYVQICLGATKGDRVLDKSPYFAQELSNLLSFLSSPQHWTGQKSQVVDVVLPFKSMTKREILREYLGDSVTEQRDRLLGRAWYESFSCYSPEESGSPCGMCKPCFRKTIAFTLEGYRDWYYIERCKAYLESSGILEQIRAGDYGRADEERDIKEFMDFCKEYGI